MSEKTSLLVRLADAFSSGGYSARQAENFSRRTEAMAWANYYSGVGRVLSSAPPLQPNSGATPTRADSPYALGERDIGNYRWQDTYEIAWERWRSRQLEQNNWLASATIDRCIERVIGTLIRVEPRTESKEFNLEVRQWLKDYWNTRACDARNLFTYSKICQLFFRAKMRDGDCGLILADDGFGNPKIQLIEAQRIKNPTSVDDLKVVADAGTQVVDGIEMNDSGAPVAYWVSTQPPGQGEKFARIDQRNFIFQARTTRYGNVRGEPAFRGGYWIFDQVIGYLEAVVQAARIGASAAMIQKRRNPGTPGNPNVVGTLVPNSSAGAAITGQQQRLAPITPGMINVIGTDEDLVAFNPSQPTQSMPAAVDVFSRFIGIRFGLTLEDVLLDFSKTTYSSSKAARAAATAAAAVEQEDFSLNFITRIYQWSLSKAVKSGIITTPAPERFWDHEWLPPIWPSVEPLKDIQAAERAIALGVETRSNYASGNSYDFEELCVQNEKDQDMMIAHKLSTAIAVGTTSGNLQPEEGSTPASTTKDSTNASQTNTSGR